MLKFKQHQKWIFGLLIVFTLILWSCIGFKKIVKEKNEFYKVHQKKFEEFTQRKFIHTPVKKKRCIDCHLSLSKMNELAKKGNDLCFTCHAVLQKGLTNSSVHSPFKDGKCTICHDPHATDNPFQLIERDNELCLTCHNMEDIKKAHFGIIVKKMKCIDCHNPHTSEEKKLIYQKQHHPFAERQCDTCHAPSGSSGEMKLAASPPDLCFNCHGDLADTLKKKSVHQPFKTGECSKCHSSHAAKRDKFLLDETFVLCVSCHDNSYSNNHPVVAHPGYQRGLMNPLNKEEPFSCVSCHNPHGSNETKLKISTKQDFCIVCHQR